MGRLINKHIMKIKTKLKQLLNETNYESANIYSFVYVYFICSNK